MQDNTEIFTGAAALNHGKDVYLINSEGIVYHQDEVLYIIIAKEIQPAVDDMHLR